MSQFVTAQKGDMKWMVQKDCAEWVLENVAGHVAADGAEGWRLVKENNVRAIFTLPLFGPKENLGYLKRYKVRGAKDALKHLFVPSKAAAEWDAANRLMELGVPTARPLAMAERRSFGLLRESILLSEAIPDGRPLSELLPAVDDGARADLLDRLARLVRDFHDRGCFHGDLHVGNVLASGLADGAKLFVLDLHRVGFFEALTRAQRLENLAMIWASIRTRVTPHERQRLLETYAEGIPEIANDLDGCRARLERRVEEMARVRLRSRTKRCLVRSSGFDVGARGGYRVYRKREIAEEVLMKAVEEHIKGAAEIVKNSDGASVSRMDTTGEGGAASVCVKENTYDLMAQVKNLFRPSRGRAAWMAGHGLTVRGVKTCNMLGLVEERCCGLVRRSFLVMEELKNTRAFDFYIYDNLVNAPVSRKRRFAEAAANLFAQLHGSGIYHADLKASNILVREKGDGWDLHLVDLDNVTFPSTVPLSCRVRNMAQINSAMRMSVSNADRVRFWRRYRSRCAEHYGNEWIGRIDSREVMRRIIRETARRDCVWNRPEFREPKSA